MSDYMSFITTYRLTMNTKIDVWETWDNYGAPDGWYAAQFWCYASKTQQEWCPFWLDGYYCMIGDELKARSPDEAIALAVESYERWIEDHPEYKRRRIGALESKLLNAWDRVIEVAWCVRYPMSCVERNMRRFRKWRKQ